MADVVKIIGRGKNGWHVKSVDERGNECSISGIYDDEIPQRYLEKAEEGALVYDADGANTGAFAAFVMRGPMVDHRLPDGSWEKMDMAALKRMAPGMGGGFKTLTEAQLKAGEGPGPLDTVSVDVYVKLLRAIPGVKVGRVQSGQVVWE